MAFFRSQLQSIVRAPLRVVTILMIALMAACSSSGSASSEAAASKKAPERSSAELALREKYAKPPAQWPSPVLDAGVTHRELGLLPAPPAQPENPQTPQKIELGKALFFDPRISGSGQIACASCHDPDLAWADGRTTSFGHGRKELKRNSPSVLNAAYVESLFWDGRAPNLESQALAVLANPDEMRTDSQEMTAVLASSEGYRKLFEQAFGDATPTLDRVGKAIGAFVRTIVGGHSDFDKFLRGDRDALSDEALRGLHLFRTRARCLNCHNGPELSDGKFHDLGLSYYKRKYEDLGRYSVTSRPADVGAFRTPSLRNVTRTAPYMHNGLFDLDGVLNMYSSGMPTIRRTEELAQDPLFPTKSPLLQPLKLTAEEKRDLKAFLTSLEEPKRRMRPPELPTIPGR